MPRSPTRFRRAPLLFSALLALVLWPAQPTAAQRAANVGQTCTGDPDCDDGNECTVCVCDPDNPDADPDGCVCEPVTDGTPCADDGFACTDDVCAGGACGVPDDANCDDGVACTLDVCDPSDPLADLDGCVFTPDDDACDDGNECTVCICDPDNPDADPDGCVCEPVTDGTPCADDGFACTDDVCAGGACSVPNDANCDDGVACTADLCDPSDPLADLDGCVFTPDDADCDDGVVCTVDVCDPSDPLADLDGCVFTPDDDACDDGNPCTDCTCDPDNPAANVEGCVCVPVPIPCTATSAGSGDWTNPASWSISGTGCPAGVYPDNDKCFTWTVVIQNNHEITLNADITVDELILDGTGADLNCVECIAPLSRGGSWMVGGNTPPILRIPLEFAFSAGDGSGGVAAQGPTASLRVLGNLETPGVPGTLCVSCNGTQVQCSRATVNVLGAFDPQASDCFGFAVCEDSSGVHLFPQGVDPIIACCLPGKLQCTKLPLEECLAVGGSPHCDKSCAAVVAEGLCVGAIPAASTWGLLLTGLLILTAASIVCRRPRRAAA